MSIKLPPQKNNLNVPTVLSTGDMGRSSIVPDKKKQVNPALHWFFTYNNPPSDFVDLLRIVPQVKRFVVQKERGEQSGIPHLQGYIEFKSKVRPCSVIDWTSAIHWENARNPEDAIKYCQKEHTRIGGPWFKDIKPIRKVQEHFTFKKWQIDLLKMLDDKPHPRHIYWFYDPVGGTGKTEIAKWLAINKGAIVLGGKGSDMKDAISRCDNYPEIIIIDVPRSSHDFISYQGIEEVKNGIFFSGKYESKMVMGPIPHLIVLSNQLPDTDKLSADRWQIIYI